MAKKKAASKRLDARALERYIVKLQEAAIDQHFQTSEEAEYWVHEQLLSGDLARFVQEPKSDLEKAQDLAYQAFEEASEKRRISMANKALQISADCADAYVIKAEEYKESNREKAEELYRLGVEAGRRAVGDSAIANVEREFWTDYTTRPFMRAVYGLGDLLQDFGDTDKGIEQWYELLRLDPEDGMQVTLRLVPALVAAARFDEAKNFLDKCKSNPPAAFAYSRALMLFKQNGESADARNALYDAMKVNGNVVRQLLVITHTLPFNDAEYTLEEEAEAEDYVMYAYIDWENTEDALDWVADTVADGLEKQVQKMSLSNTFPGLQIADSGPNMIDVLGGNRGGIATE